MSRRIVLISLGVFTALGLICVGWAIYIRSRPPVQLSDLAHWVRSQGYEMHRPLRTDWTPGSVIRVEGDRTLLVLPASDLFSGGSASPGSSIDVAWTKTLKADESGAMELFGLTSAEIAHSGLTEVEVRLHDVTPLSIPLGTLQEVVKNNSRLQRAVRRKDRRLFVIAESLVVDKLELRFRSADAINFKETLHLDKLAAATGAQLTVTEEGTVVSKQPLHLGFKAAALSAVADVLGGGDRTLAATMVTLDELRRERERTMRLYSQYQVFALVMGLGNYPYGSERAGGELPGALASTRLVADSLARFGGGGEGDRVSLFGSQVLNGAYDPYQRRSKADIEAAVDDFVARVRDTMNPSQEAVVFFYFFGHGLADAETQYVYLVPETFVDDPERSVLDLHDDLIHVAWIRDRLLEVTHHVVLLVDACRSHRQPERFNPTRLDPLSQLIADVDEITRFASGVLGPQPMLFGSPSGTYAHPVPYRIDGLEQSIGPLAARLDTVVRMILDRRQTLDLRGFVKAMQQPISLGSPPQAARAYTALREDFLAELLGVVLASPEPMDVAARAQPYAPSEASPTSEPPRQPLWPSGARVKRLNDVPLPDIEDFAFHADDTIVLLDSEWRLWRWTIGAAQPVLLKDELHFPSLGGSRQAGIYVQDNLNGMLLAVQSDGTLRPIREDSDVKFFAQAHDRRSVVAVSDDATVGTLDPILRLQGSDATLITKLDVTALDPAGFVEWEPGVFYYASQFENTLQRFEAGESELLMTLPFDAQSLTATARYLYVLSYTGRFLGRIDRQGDATMLDLLDVGLGDVYLRQVERGGFHAASDETLFVSSAGYLLELDLSQARWQPVPSDLGRTPPNE